MNLEKLGYTEKWIQYGIINVELLENQLDEYHSSGDHNTEHYRYGAFLNWLKSKKGFTNKEIERYLELASEDSNKLMAGSAVKELFKSTLLTDEQFDQIKINLSQCGEWTNKLIQKETLKRRINKKSLSNELFEGCINYTKHFKDNSLLEWLLKSPIKLEFLHQLKSNDFSKRIRNKAKLNLQMVHRDSKGNTN